MTKRARLRVGVLAAILVVAIVPIASAVPAGDIAYLYGTPYTTSGQYNSTTHALTNVNNGIYGNSNSWIPAGGTPAPWDVGIALGQGFRIDAVALGRDNLGTYTDRVASNFTIASSTGGGPVSLRYAETGRTDPLRVQYDFINTDADSTDRYEGTEVQTFVADDVQLNITASSNGTEVCIDELEIYGRPATVPGMQGANGNLAQLPSASPFASSLISGGAYTSHQIDHINDGLYGNANSWIGGAGTTSYCGVSLGKSVQALGLAFGRDNLDAYADRVVGSYTVEVTNVMVSDYTDPAVPWTPIGVVDRNYAPGDGATVRANFPGRMEYASPVGAAEITAVRVVAATGACIDELEVLGVAMPDDNLALAGTAHASSIYAGGTNPSHQIDHLNDGLYGNDNSWLSATSNTGIAGVTLDGDYRIDAIAFGRSNTGSHTDRVAVDFTIESSTGGGAAVVRQTVTGRTDPLRVQYDFINPGSTGAINTFVADDVQINITASSTNDQPCIDELEIYGRPTTVAGFDSASATGNLAQAAGATPFATSVIPGYPDRHSVGGLTDGLYGNSNSWIPAGSGTEYGGVNFGSATPVYVGQIAFGRDNTDVYKDWMVATYELEYTLDDPADPKATWQSYGTVDRNYAPGGGSVRPLFAGRMAYDVANVPVRGVRVKAAGGMCIDELEAIGMAPRELSFKVLEDSTAAASSAMEPTFGVAHLNDGIQGTSTGSPARYWNENTNGVAGDWARLTWSEDQLVRLVNLRMPITAYDLPTSTLPDVKVQYLRPSGNPAVEADWLDYDAARTLIAPNPADTTRRNDPNNYYAAPAILTRGVRAWFGGTGNDDGWNFLDEIQAIGSTNIAPQHGTPVASSQHSSNLYPADALNDNILGGNNASGIPFYYWNDGTARAYPDWAGILFGGTVYVDGVNLRTPIMNITDINRLIEDVSLEYLIRGGDPNNNADWKVLVDDITLLAPNTDDGSQNNLFTFAPVWTAGIRAQFGPGSGNVDGWNYLDEIQVYGHVPEPASLTLVGAGLLALLRRRKARR